MEANTINGGVADAGLFKLGAQDQNVGKASAGKGATIAAVAGLLALAVAGVLTFMLYQHWQFLSAA